MPGIPTPNTDIAALVPATVKGRSSPIISTAPGERDGTRAGDGGGSQPSSNWLSHSQVSRAPAPLLRFTDLISGPSTGLGDGQGSGVIVTIWAQGVGDSQGTGQVYFTDSQGNDIMEREIQENYNKIKQDVVDIVKKEMERIQNDPALQHLVKEVK